MVDFRDSTSHHTCALVDRHQVELHLYVAGVEAHQTLRLVELHITAADRFVAWRGGTVEVAEAAVATPVPAPRVGATLRPSDAGVGVAGVLRVGGRQGRRVDHVCRQRDGHIAKQKSL